MFRTRWTKMLGTVLMSAFMLLTSIGSAFAVVVDQQNTSPISSYRYFYNDGGNGYQWAVQTFQPSQPKLNVASFYIKDAKSSDDPSTQFKCSVYKKSGSNAILLTSGTFSASDGYQGWKDCKVSPALTNLVPNNYYGLRLEVNAAEDNERWYWAGNSNGPYTRGYMIWDCMTMSPSCIGPTNPFSTQDFLFKTWY